MKIFYVLLGLLIFASCSREWKEERIIEEVETVLPGTWEIEKLHNFTSDLGNFQDVYYQEGEFLSNFGQFEFSSFTLDNTETQNLISTILPFKFSIGEFTRPLSMANQTLLTIDGEELMQIEIWPEIGNEDIGENAEIVKIIDDFKLFRTVYVIDIHSEDSISLRSSSSRDEVVFDLKRIR